MPEKPPSPSNYPSPPCQGLPGNRHCCRGVREHLQKWPVHVSSLAVGWPKLAHRAGVILVGENKGSAQNRSKFWTCALPCDFCLD